MQRSRVISKDRIAAGWHASASSPAAIGNDTSVAPINRTEWLRASVRVVRNATVGILLLMSVPIAVVGTSAIRARGNALLWTNSVTRERMAEMERLRPLMSPRDPAITPMQAGLAFHALQWDRQNDELVSAPRANAAFPLLDGRSPHARVWREHKITPAMFVGLHDRGDAWPVATRLIAFTARGVSADELSYLRDVAESPVWADFDRVGGAAVVDLIGGQFVLPFRTDAVAFEMPTMRYADSKELAYAGLSRAAYYMAIGQPERAEASLRSIVSFGFAIIDNGSTLLDALIGRSIVDIGRDGLLQLYGVTGSAKGQAMAAKLGGGWRAESERTAMTAAQMRAKLLADATDPRVPRALRLQSLQQLSLSTCGTVRGMFLGASPDVAAAFEAARTTLVRFPSDQAYLDLVRDQTNRLPYEATLSGAGDRLMFGAATVTSIILDNPRVAACTRMMIEID